MPTTNFPVTKDACIARRESDNYDQGKGTSSGLAFGLYAGYRYRTLLGFSINMSGWVSITDAKLHYRTSSQISVAFGSSPEVHWSRITEAWSEGSSSGLSASNAVIYPGPATTGTNSADDSLPTSEGTWTYRTVTAMMQDVLAGSPFYGIRGIAWDGSAESNSSSDVGEIYSREQGSDAYLEITYTTNRAPNAPTLAVTGQDGAGVVASQTPNIGITITDPDAGDNLTQYQWQVANNTAFTTPVNDTTVSGSWASGSVVNAVPSTLTRGTTYYARARAYDGTSWGAWSATKTIIIAANPVVTLTEPSAAGRLGKTSYDAGSGWLSPRLNVAWSFTCPDGGTQASYRVEINSDSAGSPGASFSDSGTVADSAARSRIIGATFVEGSYYHVRVTATCSHGITVTVGYYRIRVRWAVITHAYDMGATAITGLSLANLSVTDETNGGQGRVTVEYATLSAAPPTAPSSSAWKNSIASAGLLRYFWYRAWLLTWGASPAVSPALNELKITHSTNQIIPDNWTREDAANAAGDVGAYVYGTKSLRMLGKGSSHVAYQQVPVNTDTWYTLSARVQSLGNSGAYVDLATGSGGGQLVYTTPKTATTDFEDPGSKVSAVAWYSGSATSVYVRCVMNGAVGTTAWFDAVKLEASTVVTPWSPGYIANAVVLDAGGLQIDALAGGIFRLRGSDGAARSEITLGTNGLLFGGDTPFSSPAPGALRIGPAGGNDERLQIGDDSEFSDVDVANAIGLRGIQDGSAGEIIFGNGKDTNIKRGGANLLQTDDTFQAAELRVIGGQMYRYVPLATHQTVYGGATTTADIGQSHSVEITSIPAGTAKAVSVQLVAKHSVVSPSGRFRVYDYGSAAQYLIEGTPGVVANQYMITECHFVLCGGTNNRQIDFGVSMGTAGTITYTLIVNGYWTAV
jgi:hypothetical protein